MDISKGSFVIECRNCKSQHSFIPGDARFESLPGSKRQGGQEVCHLWTKNMLCAHCGNDIGINYAIWEYPAGAFENEKPAVVGARVLIEFEF